MTLALTPQAEATTTAKAKSQTPSKTASRPKAARTPKVTRLSIAEIHQRTVDQMEEPMAELRRQSQFLTLSPGFVEMYSPNFLEGIANAAVITRVLKATYEKAEKRKWRAAENFQVFPIETLAATAPSSDGKKAFNVNGLRVGLFALRAGAKQRGILLTSSFQAINKAELKELFKKGALPPMIDNAAAEFDSYAEDLLERFNSGNRRESEYLPVNASAPAWVVGCETTLAGRFCVNARIFDSYDISPAIFYDALMGIQQSSELITEIRDQDLAWPVDRTFITRGYKTCGCGDNHYGLDLAATIGTPVRAVADGTIRNAGRFNGWGRAVVVEHELPSGNQYISLYAHLSKFKKGLKPGDVVRRGDIVALSGNSGTSVGPHLHLEIRELVEGKEPLKRARSKAERPLDPLRVLNVFNVLVEPIDSIPMP